MRTNNAAASASALSLRANSFSSTRTRFASGLAFVGPRSAASAAVRHSARTASCSPLERRSAPRSPSGTRAASRTIWSRSSAVQSSGRRGRTGAGWAVVFAVISPAPDVASRSHRDNVGCDTPVSAATADADRPLAPIIFRRTLDLNAFVYSTIGRPTTPPSLLPPPWRYSPRRR